MIDERTIEDRLREEYFELLPDIRRVAEHLEAEVRYCVLPIRWGTKVQYSLSCISVA